LAVTAEAVAKVWREHFGALLGVAPVRAPAADVDAALADDDDDAAAAAVAIAVEPALRDVARGETLLDADGLDLGRSFTMRELYRGLRALKANKAAGPDAVPVEILQLADSGEPIGADAPEPKTNDFGRALLAGCNAMFVGGAGVDVDVLASELAASAWHTVRLRPLLKKGGDATDPRSYRGIGIQSGLARLLAMMALQRLAPAVERRGLLGRSQAGFRSREEAVAQVATLLEVCGRRRSSGRPTYMLFLDFAQAYDSVPHHLLIAKLEQLGVRGGMLSFIERSLALNRAAVSVGAGGPAAATVCGAPFAVRRGVVQGCPLSPLLFSLYISDLFGSCRGVRVPMQRGDPEMRVSDLKYADDVVAFARSARGIRRQLARAGRWCLANGMRLGASKCGFMVVAERAAAAAVRHAQLETAAATEADWRIVAGAHSGTVAVIPAVPKYRYLGVEVNSDLNLAAMVRARAAAARKVVGMMTPVLSDVRVPLHERVLLAKAFVVPVVLYGAELWAGVGSLVKPLDLVLNDLWCRVLRVPRHSALFGVLSTVRCRTAQGSSLVACARAFAKWRGLSTWIAPLTQSPARGGWAVKARFMLTRADRSRELLGAALDGRTQRAKQLAGKAADDQTRRRDATLTGAQWRRYGLSATVGEARRLFHVEKGPRDLSNWAVWQVVRMRCGVFNTVRRFARIGLVDAKWRQECPFCGQEVPEDLAHLVLECAAWSAERGRFLVPVFRAAKVASWLSKPERREDALGLILGGKVGPHAARSLCRRAAGGAVAAAAKAAAPALVPVAGAGGDVLDPVANGVVGYHAGEAAAAAAAPAAAAERAALVQRSLGLNWCVALCRFLRAVAPERTARFPPLSLGPARGMAELVAPGGRPAG
jgi:hypothetical protein